MENKVNNDSFKYTYSAKEQEEIKKIRKKYVETEENKMEQLRRLDESVTNKPTVISLVLGIIGTLLLGVGMCCCMVWQGIWFIPGIIVGLIGIGIIAIAYPMYSYVLKREREKIAPEIIRLTDELLK
ncbi:MAG: hypothetical protein IJA34_17165 [Lachnospiraceae bacterium]|nr:hypothetical protein [Lachnospiraceae bacterium]